MSPTRTFHVLVRDPVAGGSFQEWVGRLAPDGLWFTMSHPPARRLQLRFLLPGAAAEVRATGEVLRVERRMERFEVHARLEGLDDEARAAVERFLEGA